MLTARPDIVHSIACDTPVAIVRASAEPRSAIESNTSSIPLTVPTSPSSGAIGTSVRITSRFVGHLRSQPRNHRVADLPRAPRQVIAALIPLVDRLPGSLTGSTFQKNQIRSITSVHMMTPEMKMKNTNGPPPSTRFIERRVRRLQTYRALLLLDHFGQHAGRLTVQHRLEIPRQCEVSNALPNSNGMAIPRPSTVAIIAWLIPCAISFGSLEPDSVMLWNVRIIPMTVPIRPSNGPAATASRRNAWNRSSCGISLTIASRDAVRRSRSLPRCARRRP